MVNDNNILVVTISNGEEVGNEIQDLNECGLNLNSSQDEVLARAKALVETRSGNSILFNADQFTVTTIQETNVIHVIPKFELG